MELRLELRHSILQTCYIVFPLVVHSAHVFFSFLFFFFPAQSINKSDREQIVGSKWFSVDFLQAILLLKEQVRKDAEA